MTTRPSIAALLLLTFTAFAQTPKPKFEVASVKLNTNNGPVDVSPRRSGEHVTMHNVNIGSLLSLRVRHRRETGRSMAICVLPDGWNWYDIEAEAPASTSDADLRLMFQSLLEERFQLKVHRETRDIKGWNLVVAKSGSKLKPATPESVIATEGRAIADGPQPHRGCSTMAVPSGRQRCDNRPTGLDHQPAAQGPRSQHDRPDRQIRLQRRIRGDDNSGRYRFSASSRGCASVRTRTEAGTDKRNSGSCGR